MECEERRDEFERLDGAAAARVSVSLQADMNNLTAKAKCHRREIRFFGGVFCWAEGANLKVKARTAEGAI